MALKHENLTGQIIQAFYKVYNELGYGFLEKVYQNAFAFELESMGFRVGQQRPIKVFTVVGQEASSRTTPAD